jgi:hypothetical protein
MKYLKIFENKILDDILDKISEDGEKNLTSWEKEYLASFGDENKRNQMEKEKKEKEKKSKSLGSYDPRKDDTDFYKNIGDEFGMGDEMSDYIKNMSDDDYIQNKIMIMWDSLYEEDMDEFFNKYKIMNEFIDKPWDELPEKVKELFGEYLLWKGYIDIDDENKDVM